MNDSSPGAPSPMVNAFGMDKVLNFRDLGGLVGADGRRVRTGQLFRSGTPGEATDGDIVRLNALGIRTLCDLRSGTEIESLPPPAGLDAEHRVLSVDEEGADTSKVREALEQGHMHLLGAHRLINGNRAMAEKHRPIFAAVVRTALDPAMRPMVVHCTAGKDRAGLASAVLLLALGVSEEDVMADFLRSNDERAQRNSDTEAGVRALMAERDIVAPESIDMTPLVEMMVVRPDYLQAALDRMVEMCGSIDGYITDGLGLTTGEVEDLRGQLLEP